MDSTRPLKRRHPLPIAVLGQPQPLLAVKLDRADLRNPLWQEGRSLSQTQIGKITGQAGATLTRSLDGLVESGFVDRLPNPADRRRIVIRVRLAAMEASNPHYEDLLPTCVRWLTSSTMTSSQSSSDT